MENLRRFFVCCFAVCFGFVFAQTVEKAPLRVGGDHNFPPYEFLDASGNPSGYNIDLCKELGKELNRSVDIRLYKWARVKEELDNGNIDLVPGIAFSTKRAKDLIFSEPHTRTWRAFFVRVNSKYKKPVELNTAKILVQQGDISEEYLAYKSFRGSRISVPSQEDALRLLASGTGDAALVNYMGGGYVLRYKKLKGIKTLPGEILPKFYCMASRNPKLIAEVDAALLRIAQDGRLQKLQDKWFGTYDPNLIQRSLRTARTRIIHGFGLSIALGMFILLILRLRKQKKRLSQKQTDLHDCKEKLRRLEEDFQFFRTGPLVSYKFNIKDQRLLFVSEGIKQWGYDPKAAESRVSGFSDIVFSEDRPWIDDRFKKQLAESITSDIKQYRVITKTGEIHWVMDYNVILMNSEQGPLLYGYMIDITDQKSLEAELLESKEKAESASIAKGHFLANMSHEIRTPLNGIMGFIQVLMQMECSSQQREYYDIIYSSGQSLMKIVNDILDVSKIESGKMDLIQNDFNPIFLINDTVKSFAYQREKPGVDIRTNLSDKIPEILNGDMLRLRQILINLLQNAMKFTEEGYIEITAEIYNRSDNDVRILFCVSDTGIGIDPVKQKDIFDNFSQLDNRITRKYGGTGLGLSIVKRLVELMGGFVWVESDPGKGSRFFFILPFKLQSESVLESDKQVQRQLGRGLLPELKILLVEDELVNQTVTRRQLESWNLKVEIAENGAAAVEFYLNNEYDCILMDIQMPVMDGVAATRKIRQIEAETGRHTTIYAYTAAAMTGDRERFLEAGMDDYISKPVDIELLYSLLLKVNKQTSDGGPPDAK